MPPRIVLYPALVTVVAVVVCTTFQSGAIAPAAPPAEQQVPTAVPTEPAAPSERLEVVLAPNPSQEGLTDVFSSNPRTGEVTYLISLENVATERFHGQELHQGNLYIIRLQVTPGEPVLDELWRYSPDGQAALLFSGRAIDFRTSPNEEYLAVKHMATEEGGNPERLVFLTREGGLAYEVNTRLLNPDFSIGPVGWSTEGREFWAAMQFGQSPLAFLRLATGSWTLRLYDVSAQPLSPDHHLNTDTARLAFSNYPSIFDADATARLQQNQTPITLWVLDLETQELRTIATTIARPFHPRWLDARTLEYNHPEEEGRVFVILE